MGLDELSGRNLSKIYGHVGKGIEYTSSAHLISQRLSQFTTPIFFALSTSVRHLYVRRMSVPRSSCRSMCHALPECMESSLPHYQPHMNINRPARVRTHIPQGLSPSSLSSARFAEGITNEPRRRTPSWKILPSALVSPLQNFDKKMGYIDTYYVKAKC